VTAPSLPYVGDLHPPYLLAGDSWAFLAFASTRRIRAALAGAPVPSLLGLTPVVLQATHYNSARPLGAEWSVGYSEVSATALVSAGRWSLAPYRLLVDEPLAQQLGEVYGFPKEVVSLRLSSTRWTARLTADEGRYLTAARGLGAFLLWPLARVLATARLGVVFPHANRSTTFAFQRVDRIAPTLGIASTGLAAWAGAAFVWPIGVVIQGFRFVLEEPQG